MSLRKNTFPLVILSVGLILAITLSLCCKFSYNTKEDVPEIVLTERITSFEAQINGEDYEIVRGDSRYHDIIRLLNRAMGGGAREKEPHENGCFVLTINYGRDSFDWMVCPSLLVTPSGTYRIDGTGLAHLMSVDR